MIFHKMSPRTHHNSLRSKRFQSSYSTKVGEGAKKWKGGRGEEEMLARKPTILENAP